MSKFSLRLMLVICAVLFSLVVALSTALIVSFTGRDAYVALSASAAAFVATLTLLLVMFTVLLQ